MNTRRFVAITAAGLIAAGGLTGTTTAAAAPAHRSAFAQQASAAGLSAAQAAYVQQRINGVLASTPSARQLSANTVEIAGHPLTIGAPGQAAVRAIGLSPAAAATAGACPHLWLCTFHNGVLHNYYSCTTIYLTGWTGQGYIFNNQSRGTVSEFYRIDRSVYIHDVAPDMANREVNWNPIWSFKVC